ncbi:MAG: hypothetical protein KDE14_11615 [Rhodobacteraceae bacterium]|nr:hypothetical protein [Paracoccaceae bacterium]
MTFAKIRNSAFVLALTVAAATVADGVQLFSPAAHAADAPQLMHALGTISFPNSGNRTAQEPFLIGVKALHNFQFEEAAEAFRAAQTADPKFALAYWGEAMSYNHPLWAQQDSQSARAVLARFAPTAEKRAALAPTARERGLLAAVETLYATDRPEPGDKLARDIAYEGAMGRLHRDFPDDDEIAIFHALSLLGTVRPGDTGVKRQMQAGAIALDVFGRNPNHPGAAHFVIHSFDDPEHAILALPAARAYAGIAPDAPHALHMPSHIFVQLGMWEGVVASNTVGFKSAVALAERKHLDRGRDDFHALSWLQYGHQQLGQFDLAAADLETGRSIERDHPTPRVRDGVLSMWARQIVETEDWANAPSSLETGDTAADASAQHANHRTDGSNDFIFAVGLAAAKRGDLAVAQAAQSALKSAKSGTAYRDAIIDVGIFEIGAAIADSKSQAGDAEKLLQEAVAAESKLGAPSGPPRPMKPAFEMYGEFLLAQGRNAEAAEQFKAALSRTPNRAKSVHGLVQARPQAAAAN